MKKIILSFFSVLVLLTVFSLGNSNIMIAQTPKILENGNWDLGYTPNDSTSYYASLEGLKGEDFIDELNKVISTDLTYYKYGRSTNQTAYHLRTLDEYPLDNSKVLLIYSGTTEAKTADGNTWAQEHVWPKSKGFSDESYVAYRDLHHLRPVNPSLNSSKNNHDVGNVLDFSTTPKDLAYGNKSGSIDGGTIFEPRDAVKGDVARILFYMDIRYKGETTTDPNLTLVSEGLPTTSSVGDGYFGHLDSLLQWHEQDPVDDYELRRNDLAHGIQGNRNPFVDHPEYVDRVYGDADDGDPDDPNYNQNKANNVINAINSIGTVSLDSLNAILKAENMYYLLSEAQRGLVTNYQVLLDSRKEYDRLFDEIQVFNEYSADFSDVSGLASSYSPDKIGILEDHEWYFSYAYKGSDAWLGSNNANPVLSEKFQSFYTNTYGASLEMQWDIENATYISFTFGNNTNKPTLDIFVSYDQGETYQKLDKVDNSSSKVSAYATPADDVRFALVLTGSAGARIHVDKVEIIRHANVSKAINNINEFDPESMDAYNYDLLVKTERIFEIISDEEFNIINNYDLYLTKKTTFNNNVTSKITQINNDFSVIYNEYLENIFTDEESIKEFYNLLNNLIPPLKEGLSDSENINLFITSYNEVLNTKNIINSVDLDNIDYITAISFYHSYLLFPTNQKEAIKKDNNYNEKVTMVLAVYDEVIKDFDSLIEQMYTSLLNDVFTDNTDIKAFYDNYPNLSQEVLDELTNLDKLEEFITLYEEILELKEKIEKTKINYSDTSSFNELYLTLSTSYIESLAKNEYYNQKVTTIINYYNSYTNVVNEFTALKTTPSLMFNYNSSLNVLIEGTLKMRFGAVITKDLYNNIGQLSDNIEYGIAINNEKYIKLTPVMVDNPNDKNISTSGNYYQFALVLTDIPLSDINVVNNFKIYVKIDNDYYYMQEANYSFTGVAKAYLDNKLEDVSEHSKILEYLVSLIK